MHLLVVQTRKNKLLLSLLLLFIIIFVSIGFELNLSTFQSKRFNTSWVEVINAAKGIAQSFFSKSQLSFYAQAQAQTPPPPPPKQDQAPDKKETVEEQSKPTPQTPPKKETVKKPPPKKKNFFETLIDKIKAIFVKEEKAPAQGIPRKGNPKVAKVATQTSVLAKRDTVAPPVPQQKSDTKVAQKKPVPEPQKTTVTQTELPKPPPPPPAVSKPKVETPSPPQQGKTTLGATTTQEKPKLEQKKEPAYIYNDKGRRDPFINILEEPNDAGDATKLDVGSLKLVGIINLGHGELKAMLEDSDKNAIFLSEGDKISRGQVIRITTEKIVFSVTDIDTTREISKPLRENNK